MSVLDVVLITFQQLHLSLLFGGLALLVLVLDLLSLRRQIQLRPLLRQLIGLRFWWLLCLFAPLVARAFGVASAIGVPLPFGTPLDVALQLALDLLLALIGANRLRALARRWEA